MFFSIFAHKFSYLSIFVTPDYSLQKQVQYILFFVSMQPFS